jgi:hypothetical protein
MARVSDVELDGLRAVGDPAVDELVARQSAATPGSDTRLLGSLFRTARLPEDDPLVSAYLGALAPAPPIDQRQLERGQSLFQLFGPEILLILGSSSLPLAYAAGNGVQAVYRARRLKDDPLRRLCDTAQMVLNVMQPGELEPGGVGWSGVQKVRLIHALVRHHIATSRENPWSPSWGVPINQEDLAGTLLSFSAAVLHGLRRMGARVSQGDADAYIFAWSHVGRLLGVDESVLPWNEEEAMALALRIGARNVRPTPEGRELTRELLEAVETLFPFRGYALALTRFFLEESVYGAEAIQALGLPVANWTSWLVRLRAAQKRMTFGLLDRVPGGYKRRTFIARRFAQQMILLERPDDRVPFEVPTALRRAWGLHPA